MRKAERGTQDPLRLKVGVRRTGLFCIQRLRGSSSPGAARSFPDATGPSPGMEGKQTQRIHQGNHGLKHLKTLAIRGFYRSANIRSVHCCRESAPKLLSLGNLTADICFCTLWISQQQSQEEKSKVTVK